MGSKTEMIKFIKDISEEEASELLEILRLHKKEKEKSKGNKNSEFANALKNSFGIWKDKKIADGASYQKEIRARWKRH